MELPTPVVLVRCRECKEMFTPADGVGVPLTCKCSKSMIFRQIFFSRGEWKGWVGKYQNWYITDDKEKIKKFLMKGK